MIGYFQIKTYANIWKSLLLKKTGNICRLTFICENGGQDPAPNALVAPKWEAGVCLKKRPQKTSMY